MNGLSQILNNHCLPEGACQHLRSAQKLETYAKGHFHGVEPQELKMSADQNGKVYTCQYIPILEILKSMLKHDNIFSEVVKGHKSNDKVLCDLCYGRIQQEQMIFASDP